MQPRRTRPQPAQGCGRGLDGPADTLCEQPDRLADYTVQPKGVKEGNPRVHRAARPSTESIGPGPMELSRRADPRDNDSIAAIRAESESIERIPRWRRGKLSRAPRAGSTLSERAGDSAVGRTIALAGRRSTAAPLNLAARGAYRRGGSGPPATSAS